MSSISLCPTLSGWFYSPEKVQAEIPVKPVEPLSPKQVLEQLQKLKPEEIEEFFQTRLPELIESIDLTSLKETILKMDKSFTSAADHANKQTPLLPQNDSSQMHEEQSSSLLFRFFFNLVDTFATAFNFYDESDPPTSIYEKQVLITIYYRFFQIPLALALILQPLVLVAWQAYLVSMAILAAVSAGIYVYMKYFRPFPTIIPSAQRVDDLVAKEFPRPITGLDIECDALLSKINRSTKKRPIMVLGETGSGKTTLIYKLQQKIKDKKIILIHGGNLAANSIRSGIGDKLKQIRFSLAGFEDQAIVVIDEFQAVKNFELIKEFIRTPGLQCIGLTTWDAFQKEIIPADRDRSLRRSFGSNFIRIEMWKSAQVESLLEEMAYDAWDITFVDGALKKIVELTDGDFKELPQPAKAIELFEDVIEKCRNNYEVTRSDELKDKKAELSRLEWRSKRRWPMDDATEKFQRDNLELEIGVLEKRHTDLCEQRSIFRSLMEKKEKLKKQLIEDAMALNAAHNNNETLDEEFQKRYLFSYFFLLPEMVKQAEKGAASLNLQVDEKFVKSVFKEYKKKKETGRNKAVNPFYGIIDHPSDEAIQEVKTVFEKFGTVAHGKGQPSFEDLLEQRWKSTQDKLKLAGFLNYSMYEAIVCNACDLYSQK